MSGNIQGTFISEKVSKIRWRRENSSPAKSFLTGSWDNAINQITHWTFKATDEEELNPTTLSCHPFSGDVTEIKFVSHDLFAVSSSLGFVKLLQLLDDSNHSFKEHVTWKNLHYFKTSNHASCTAISNFERDIASVGEDGRINLLTATEKKPVRIIDNADSCSLYSIDFLRHSEILTGNIRGHMKIWDLRSNQDIPVSSFMFLDTSRVELTSITHHPSQKHIVVAGSGDGSLTVWDIRHSSTPVCRLDAHAKSVSEIMFHPDRPENLFTCSQSGELWQWNGLQNSKLTLDNTDTHWLKTMNANCKVNVTSLCSMMHKPINSIDIDKSTLICGCDNEAIYIVQDIIV